MHNTCNFSVTNGNPLSNTLTSSGKISNECSQTCLRLKNVSRKCLSCAEHKTNINPLQWLNTSSFRNWRCILHLFYAIGCKPCIKKVLRYIDIRIHKYRKYRNIDISEPCFSGNMAVKFKMLRVLEPRYQIPSKSTFTRQRTAIKLYDSTRENVLTSLRNVEFYAATTDLWSSRGMTPYIHSYFVNSFIFRKLVNKPS
jgi:hypothetical protein